MKKSTIASKVEKNWTVLLVDGQGRIRRIRNFRRKLTLLLAFGTSAIVLAGVMGILYGGSLQKQKSLADNLDRLEERVAALQQQNELLKVRAVRLEAQAAGADHTTVARKVPAASLPKTEATPAKAEAAPPKIEATPAKSEAAPSKAAPAPREAEPEPARQPAASAEAPAQTDEKAEAPEEQREPQVDAEALKVDYQAETETIAAQFVIKNIGSGSAGGRAVVVLQTEEGRSQLWFALPSVPLKEGRPIGNQGRRFSISRFMTLKLDRRFAEPGTRFVRAMIYAYTLEGRPLLDKTFDVDLAIPEKEKPPQTDENPLPTAAPLGLTLPEPETETPTGVQP